MSEELPSIHFLRCLMLYEFHKKNSAPVAAKNICDVYGDKLSTSTCQEWFRKFKSGDLCLTDEPRGGTSMKLEDTRLRVEIESNPEISILELSDRLQCPPLTVQEYLRKITKFWRDICEKFDVQMHDLNEENKGLCVGNSSNQFMSQNNAQDFSSAIIKEEPVDPNDEESGQGVQRVKTEEIHFENDDTKEVLSEEHPDNGITIKIEKTTETECCNELLLGKHLHSGVRRTYGDKTSRKEPNVNDESPNDALDTNYNKSQLKEIISTEDKIKDNFPVKNEPMEIPRPMKTYTNKGQANRQLRNKFECLRCKKKFNTKDSLKMHIFSHKHMTPAECPVCKKVLRQKGYLKVHINIHTGEKAFECLHCQKTFRCKGDLNYHKCSHPCEMAFECSICKKQLGNMPDVKIHMASHTTETIFKCPSCELAFSPKSTLQLLIFPNTKEKVFECSGCKNIFRLNGGLKLHNSDRSKALPELSKKHFKCFQCKMMFTCISDLKQHFFTHTGGKVFKCSQCTRIFTTKDSLINHLIIHRDQEIFECSHCNKKFKHKYSLKKHTLLTCDKLSLEL